MIKEVADLFQVLKYTHQRIDGMVCGLTDEQLTYSSPPPLAKLK